MTDESPWPVRRFSHVVAVRDGLVDPEADEYADVNLIAPNHIEPGTGRILGLETAREQGASSGKVLVHGGDVIYSKIRPALNKVTIAPSDCLASADMYALLPAPELLPRFLQYQLLAKPFLDFATEQSMRVAMPKVNRATLAAAPILVPTIPEQRRVAKFLDRETAKIDALIAKQDALDAAVRERMRNAQDSLVSLSTSGMRMKYLVDEIDLRAGPDCERLPLLSVSIHWGVRRRDEVTDDPPRADDLGNYKVVCSGDIVVNRMRAFQGALGRSPVDGLVSPDYLVLRTRKDVRSDWLAAAMRTPEFISEMAARVRGIGSSELGTVRTPRINLDDLGEIRLDVPSAPQQRERYVVRASSESQASRLLQRISGLTDALRERRAALITAAVTGRLDVTTYGKAG